VKSLPKTPLVSHEDLRLHRNNMGGLNSTEHSPKKTPKMVTIQEQHSNNNGLLTLQQHNAEKRWILFLRQVMVISVLLFP
jgi:hypothetical protein